jgi:hypothetical protein
MTTPEKDTFRIELRNAKLCMELDCNTIFDAGVHRHCPTCGGAEFYPLESWLNRDRTQRRPPARREDRAAAFAVSPSVPRPLWLERVAGGRVESESEMAAGSARSRRPVALRRRAG